MKNKHKYDERRDALIEKLKEFYQEIISTTSEDQTVECYLYSEDAKALNKYITWTETSNRSPYKIGILNRLNFTGVKFIVLLSPELKESKFVLREKDSIRIPTMPRENPIEKLKQNKDKLIKEAYRDIFKLPGGNNGKA